MIICHKHKFIFIKPRKVAGTSFEIALSKFLGPNDISTKISPDDEKYRLEKGFRGAQNYQKNYLQVLLNPRRRDFSFLVRFRQPELYYNHISAQKIREICGEETWRSYRKISPIRNPWSQFLSYYQYVNRNDRNTNFEEWSKANINLIGMNNEQYKIDGEIVVDEFIRFENLAYDVSKLESSIPSMEGLWETFRETKAKSGFSKEKGKTLTDYYSGLPEVSEMIEKRCHFEINKFGYSLP